MRIETALRKRDRACQSLRDQFSSARFYGPTSATMSDDYTRLCATMSNCPQWVRAYLDGYREALIDQLYAEDLVFGAWIDGTFYSTHRNRPDYYEAQGLSAMAYATKDKVSGHYWQLNVAKPFFTSPSESAAS